MDDLLIPATNETPEVSFRYSESRLLLRGESYPENAAAFYAPIRASLQSYLGEAQAVEANFELRYFNSSSTKLIRSLFSLLHNAAQSGKQIVANWYYDPDDDMMFEFGSDLKDEFGLIEVNVRQLASTGS